MSVIYANLHGLGQLGESVNDEEILARLDGLIALFDASAETHGVEKIKTIGADYLALCGANVARLDHARRSLEFAEDLLEQVTFFNQQHGLKLTLYVGLAAGSVVTGVVGRSLRVFEVWGKTVDEAMDILAKEAPVGGIWMTDAFKGELDDAERLQPVTSSLGEVWELGQPKV